MSALPAWGTVQVATTFPKWTLLKWEYMQEGDPCWNASVNIYVVTLTKAGVYQPGIKVWQDWKEDRASDVTKALKDAPDYCGRKFGTTFVMSGDSSFDPNKGQVGPYTIYVDGVSDRLSGLGLPLKRHNQYLLTFGWTESPIVPPPPPPTSGHWNLGNPNNHDDPQIKWVTTV